MVLYNTSAPRKKCMKPHWEKLPVNCTDLEEKTKKLEKKVHGEAGYLYKRYHDSLAALNCQKQATHKTKKLLKDQTSPSFRIGPNLQLPGIRRSLPTEIQLLQPIFATSGTIWCSKHMLDWPDFVLFSTCKFSSHL